MLPKSPVSNPSDLIFKKHGSQCGRTAFHGLLINPNVADLATLGHTKILKGKA